MLDHYDFVNGDSEPVYCSREDMSTVEWIILPIPAIGLFTFLIYFLW